MFERVREVRPSTWFASIVLAVVMAFVVLGPLFASQSHDLVDWEAINSPPTTTHWFGTDNIGRDVYLRSLVGGRISLAIAFLATFVSFCIGLPWGATAGYLGGMVDQAMMRFVDALYAIPFVLIVILLVVLVGRHFYLLFIGLGAVSWLDIARISRGQTLSVRHEQYVDAARAVGSTQPRIVMRHIVPNIVNPALVYATLTIPGVIIAESFISFLGLGIQEPMTSWGVLIADGTRNLHTSWWQLAFPTALLALTLLCLYILSDRIREKVIPQLVRR